MWCSRASYQIFSHKQTLHCSGSPASPFVPSVDWEALPKPTFDPVLTDFKKKEREREKFHPPPGLQCLSFLNNLSIIPFQSPSLPAHAAHAWWAQDESCTLPALSQVEKSLEAKLCRNKHAQENANCEIKTPVRTLTDAQTKSQLQGTRAIMKL